MILTTNRLILRYLKDDDLADVYFNYANDDEVTKYLLQTSGCDIEDEVRQVITGFDYFCSIRLVSLAAQRYITEVISKANEYNKERRNHESAQNEVVFLKSFYGQNVNSNRDAILVEDLQNAYSLICGIILQIT